MSLHIKLAIGLLLTLAINYLIFSFIGWSFNPGEWMTLIRVIALCFCAFCYFWVSLIIVTFNDKE